MRENGHIFFLNRVYWPEEPATAQLLTDLAEALVVRGWAVTVITRNPGNRLPPSEIRNGVRIERVASSRSTGKYWHRLADYLVYLRNAFRCVRALAKRGNLIVPLTDPPLLGAFVQRLASRHGWRVVPWLQDIYPEVAMTVGGAPWLKILQPWRDRQLRKADACVVLGTDMARLVETRGVSPEKIQIIPNWAPAGVVLPSDEAIAAVHAEWGVGDRLVIAYSGNLGRVHDLDPLMLLARKLRDLPQVVFVIIGGGTQRKRLEKQAAGLPNVRFLPSQPRDRLSASLAAADVQVVTLRAGCEALVFPSKLYGIAAVARPVLFIGPKQCELAEIIRRENMGFACTRDEVEAMSAAVHHWLDDPSFRRTQGRAAETFSQRQGLLSHAEEAWNRLLNKTFVRTPP